MSRSRNAGLVRQAKFRDRVKIERKSIADEEAKKATEQQAPGGKARLCSESALTRAGGCHLDSPPRSRVTQRGQPRRGAISCVSGGGADRRAPACVE
jgi:hypothetical protein